MKIIRFGHYLLTELGCRVLIRKCWHDGVVVEHVTLWTDEETDGPAKHGDLPLSA